MHAQKGAESPSIVTGKIHSLVSPLPLSISLPRLVCAAAANNDDGRRRRRSSTCQAIPPPSKQRSRGPSTRPRKAEKGRGRNGSSPLWRPHVSTHSRRGEGRVTHLLNDVFAKSRRGDEIEQCRARFRTHTPSHVQFVRHGGLPLVLRRKRDDGHFAAEAYRYTGERTNDHS